MSATASNADTELALMLRKYRTDPLGFVSVAYPWGTGLLTGVNGPDGPQTAFLRDVGELVRARNFQFGSPAPEPAEPIKMAMSKGHGTGGSTMTAWLADWLMSTWPGSIGTVTAGTSTQLEERTWAAVRTWTDLCITSHWFDVQTAGMYAKPFICGDGITPESWKVLAFTCKPENYQSFAGQHARTSASWYQFDEASEVPDLIWETATGGLTDGQPMFFAWGQCVRNTGRFYQVCFGDQQRYWNTRTVDSRESRWPNKPEIERWREQYGEDSDYFRVRVLGLAPRASELQFIDWQRIRDAEKRQVLTFPDAPLIAGVDCSDGGSAWNVCRFRRGFDARSIPPIRIPGEHVRNDPHVLTARLAEALRDQRPERRIAAMFIDAAFGAHIAERLQSMGFLQVQTVRFGGASPDPDCANWRASMYKSAKDWLLLGAIPAEAEDKHLCNDLAAPGYHLNQTRKLVIESKADMAKRKVKSPDDGDAHCFVENTLIRTSRGPIPIQDIRIGDEVATPFGSSKVALTHRHEVESLTHVRFSDGKSLSGTPNHEIFTFSGGRSRIDALSLTFDVDVDSQWRRFLWRLASLSFIGERSSGFKQVAHTFNPEGRAHRRDFFTAGCGLIISDLFQMVSRCITSMRTGATASQVIWPFGSAVPINVSTCSEGWPTRKLSPRTWSGWNWLGLRRQSGMGHLKDSIGIASTVSKLGLTVSRSQSTARDAERGISHSSPMRPIFAQAHALRQHLSGDTSQASGRAPSAAKSLWRTATGRRPAVHVYAETVNEAQNRKSQNPVLARFVEIRSRLMAIIGLTRVVPVDVRTESVLPTSVYNLTLERHNAYYANGVLVFNCLTFAQPVGPQVIATPNPRPPSRTNRFSYMG